MKLFLVLMCSMLMVAACEKDAGMQNADTAKSLAIVSAGNVTHDFTIELALTPEQQIRGLMNRTNMAPDAGMLFVFSDEAERSFWMKNTLIPLDMLFIKRNGTIHSIYENAVPGDLTAIGSKGPVFAVLELNGGTAKSLGIKEGDVVHHVMFGNGAVK